MILTCNSKSSGLLAVLLMANCLLSGCSKDPQPAAGSGAAASGSSAESKPPVVLTAASAREILELHNRGLAMLENMQWLEAEKLMSELSLRLSDNPAVARNLAITRTLALISSSTPYSKTDNPSQYADALKNAKAAIATFESLATSDRERSLAALFSGKLTAFEDSVTTPRIGEAMKLLKEAIRLSGDRAEMWYAYASAMDGHRDHAESPELIAALQKTTELAPENLSVMCKLLEKLALGLNSRIPETKAAAQAGIVPTLQRAAVMVAPFNAAIKQQRRQDVLDIIQKALAAQSTPNPTVLLGPAMMTKNVMTPEIATQIDLRRIDLNLLEYVVADLASTLDLSTEVRTELFPPAEATVLTAFTSGSGLPEVTGASIVRSVDMNLDGLDDLIVLQDGRIRVFAKGADATWSVLMESASDTGIFTGFLLADTDRDFDRALSDIKSPSKLRDVDGDRKIVQDPAGQNRWFDTDLDVIAWNSDSVVLLQNNKADEGSRSFKAIPQAAAPGSIQDVAVADLEADGDLDLIFATSTGMAIWKCIDGVSFQPVTEGLALPSYGLSAIAIGDWNRDMAMDVVGVSADGKAGWLQNLLHGRFRWNEGLPGISGAEDVNLADFNHDARWDVITIGENGSLTVLPTNNERPEEASTQPLETAKGRISQCADIDNDGRTDVIIAGDDGIRILRGTGVGSFEDLSSLIGSHSAVLSFDTVDLDDEGDLDLVMVTGDGRLQSLINEGGHQNQWVEVVPRAVGHDDQFPANRVNMHGIGSVVEIRAGAAWQAHIVDRPKLHIGLGKATTIDTIRTTWTDGVPQHITDVELLKSRLGILAPQILSGSCPYIYTWNGERFEFFSDCLWAAPIGLVQATGDLAPTREWEYLMISGEQLKKRGDRYVLQLTEELWEAAYFDEVKLTAIDHPRDVSVFTNEKVGSPEMAAHRIHTVQNPRLPVSVTDGLGRDLLPGLTKQDQDYVQPFRGRILQGLTDEWTMEFDPGNLIDASGSPPTNVRLFLIGWVFPTNTSLNQAIIQNPNLDPPAPPSLEVIDADGHWKAVRPFIGFPSGKTKAMVVDLTGVSLTDDYRFRIRSSMELYWDQAFLTVNETDAETRSADCPLVVADLHHRGFSRRVYANNALFRNGHAPEGYDYSAVTTLPRWNSMMGRFTRYGEVTELLQKQDDQMAVLGPGDEMTVEFATPADDPPEGWVRDFVLYNVGWDKDADLNTVYGQSSEPYPYKAMTQYPQAPENSEPSSAEYQQYLRTYQTREYPRFQLRDAIRRAEF
jgi:tetratricopeptide (TPR) repeat protein